MSKKSRNIHRRPQYRLPGERSPQRSKFKPVAPTMNFSWSRWLSESRVEISLVCFALALIFGIMYYGKTKNLVLNPGEQTDLIQKYETSWKKIFPGGAKLVVVQREEREEELSLKVKDLPGVKDLDDIKKQKKFVFRKALLSYDTLPADLSIPWKNMSIEFTDPNQARNEEGKVLIVFRDQDDATGANMPIKFSFNRSVGQTHRLMTYEEYHLSVEVVTDEGDKLYLLFGLEM